MGNNTIKARFARRNNRSSVLRLAVGTAFCAALTFGTLSVAEAKTRTTMDGAVQYGCQGSCTGRYFNCLKSGQPYQTCMDTYSWCVGACQ